ncbi:hypothetical protein GGR01_003782 [Acetobacter oeni]|nr:hypothetical protein [Acetobacter oeni]
MTELSDHEPHGSPVEESECASVQAFPVFGEPSTAVEPRNASLDDPALGEHDELADVGPLYDLHVDPAADGRHPLLELRSLIATVGIELQQKWKQAEHRAHQHHAAIAILNIRRMDDGAHQQALRVYDDMTLLALDLLPGIVA